MSSKLIFIFAFLALLGYLSAYELEIKEFDQETAQYIFEQGNQAMIIFCNEEIHSQELQAYSAVIKELGDKYAFCKANIHIGLGTRLAEYIGVSDSILPTIFIITGSGKDMKKYKIEKELTEENIKQFEKDFNEEKLTPHRKSEDLPENNDSPVKKIVGKNFQDIVMDTTKDVLVKVYAPWCGHCKHLAPTYESVAKKLEHNPNIILSEYDGTKNENQEISITGYPTVFLFSAKDKNPKTFNGARTEEGIIQFLKENASHDWIEPKTTAEMQDEL